MPARTEPHPDYPGCSRFDRVAQPGRPRLGLVRETRDLVMSNPAAGVGMTAAQIFGDWLYLFAGAKSPEARTECAGRIGAALGGVDAAEIEPLLDARTGHRIEPDGTVVFMVPVD
jgi:hypothetical protein